MTANTPEARITDHEFKKTHIANPLICYYCGRPRSEHADAFLEQHIPKVNAAVEGLERAKIVTNADLAIEFGPAPILPTEPKAKCGILGNDFKDCENPAHAPTEPEKAPDDRPLFTVIDRLTGKEPDMREIALKEDWAKDLVYCDMEGFVLAEDGTLILMDECGNMAYCPPDRFDVRMRDAAFGPAQEEK